MKNEKNEIHDWVTMETANFLTVLNLCEKTYQHALLYCLIGFPGAGKSTAFSHFLEQNKNALYLRLDKTIRPKDFYVALLQLAGINDYNYDLNLRQLANKLVKVLNERPGNTILLIDDAGRFTAEFMEYFQAVFDACSGKVGIILSGTNKFENDFNLWVNQEKKGIPELDSRIMDWVKLERPTAGEIKSVAKQNGITDPTILKSLGEKCSDFRTLNLEVIDLRLKKLNAMQPA